MTIKLIEKKINKLSQELDELRVKLAQLKQKPGKKNTGRKSTHTNKDDTISIGLELPGSELKKVSYPAGITLQKIINDQNLSGYFIKVNASDVDENFKLHNGDIVRASATKSRAKKPDFNEWKKLSEEISRLWIGNANAVEEIRYQRSKNG